MPDYRKLYFDLFRATEKAIRILVEAQRAAEEEILNEEIPKISSVVELESAVGGVNEENERY